MAVYMESKLGVNYIRKLKLKINLQKRIYWIIFFFNLLSEEDSARSIKLLLFYNLISYNHEQN